MKEANRLIAAYAPEGAGALGAALRENQPSVASQRRERFPVGAGHRRSRNRDARVGIDQGR